MAILDGIEGLEVHVNVSGRGTSKEYADQEETTPTHASNYIEAVTGAEFTVNYRFAPHFQSKGAAFAIDVYIDGMFMDGQVAESNKLGSVEYKQCFSGNHDEIRGQWQLRKFAFSKLIIVEDHSSKINESMRQKLVDLGTIRICVRRVIVLGIDTECSRQPCNLQATTKISEKALKGRALSHAVELRKFQNAKKRRRINVEFIDSLDRPYATFDFKYRSMQALKELHILPRSPSPVPLEARPVDTLTLEESRELLRRLQAAKSAETTRLKREVKRERPESDDDDDDVSFMNERPCKAQRTSGAIETIDLT